MQNCNVGCVLHNFSYKFPDEEEEEEIDFQIEVDPNQCHRNSLILLGGSKKDAEARRQKLWIVYNFCTTFSFLFVPYVHDF